MVICSSPPAFAVSKNVYHEVGFQMALNEGRAAAQDNFILLADNKQIQNVAGIGFNLRAPLAASALR